MTTFASVIEIERHIEILLLSHDCVIVPEFGGFTAHHVDARYDGRDDMFLPPVRTIGFNPQLTINDSLLAQSYVEAYDISYPEALCRIANEVSEMRQILESTRTFELNGIGTLSLNEDGNYSFEPCEAGVLTPELYGLGGFNMRPLSGVEITEESSESMSSTLSETAHQNPKASDAAHLVAVTGQSYDWASEDEAKSTDFIQIRKSLLRNLAAACIALIAFFALSTPLGTPDLQKSQIDTGLLTRIMPKEITNTKDTHRLILTKDTKAEDGVTVNDESVQEDEEARNDISYYSIVLASRVTKHNAANYAERLQSKGYKATRVLITSSNVKVIYGSFNSEAQAYRELNRLHGDEAFADGWVTKVNE